MAEKTKRKRKDPEPEEPKEPNRLNTFVVVVLFAVAGVIGYGIYGNVNTPDYSEDTIIAGVPIFSTVPLKTIPQWRNVILFKEEDPARITCNFELSAISELGKQGYPVDYREGTKGVYIEGGYIYLQGESQSEVLDACHAFACLREDINCPMDLSQVQEMFSNSKQLSIVLPTDLPGSGTTYAELMGVFGYLQRKRFDESGQTIWLYPYLQEEEICYLQNVQTTVQSMNASNQSRDCDISPALYLQASDKSEIRIDGNKVILAGNPRSLHAAAVIVRDIIDPAYIRAIYGIK